MSQFWVLIIKYVEVNLMEKKLPNIYANPISKKLGNVQETFYGSEERESRGENSQSIDQKIQSIFSSRNFVYKSKVRIVTQDGDMVTTIVGRTSHSLLTLDNQTIPISRVIDIEVI